MLGKGFDVLQEVLALRVIYGVMILVSSKQVTGGRLLTGSSLFVPFIVVL